MATLPPVFNAQFFTDAGLPAAGHWLYTYESGTTTPKVTHTNQAGSADNANPIVLDAAGRCLLWLGTGEYTFVLKTPLGAATVWTRDDVGGVAEATTGDFLPLAGGTMTGPIILPGSATTALQAVPKQQLDSTIATLSASLTASTSAAITAGAMPIGSIVMWLTGTAPTNWLHLNGQAVSRTTYASLFALFGTTFGVGDGSTTFNVPDVRGDFPRFWDASRGVDAGRAIGTAQAAAFASHSHLNGVGDGNTTGFVYEGAITGMPGAATASMDTTGSTPSHQGYTSTEGGAETRPRNYAFMAIVKAL
jgi:microcystin-dependent protein